MNVRKLSGRIIYREIFLWSRQILFYEKGIERKKREQKEGVSGKEEREREKR